MYKLFDEETQIEETESNVETSSSNSSNVVEAEKTSQSSVPSLKQLKQSTLQTTLTKQSTKGTPLRDDLQASRITSVSDKKRKANTG